MVCMHHKLSKVYVMIISKDSSFVTLVVTGKMEYPNDSLAPFSKQLTWFCYMQWQTGLMLSPKINGLLPSGMLSIFPRHQCSMTRSLPLETIYARRCPMVPLWFQNIWMSSLHPCPGWQQHQAMESVMLSWYIHWSFHSPWWHYHISIQPQDDACDSTISCCIDEGFTSIASSSSNDSNTHTNILDTLFATATWLYSVSFAFKGNHYFFDDFWSDSPLPYHPPNCMAEN